MRFAKYWIRDAAPEARAFIAWGWSNTSVSEARAIAIERSRKISQWFQNDQLRRYPYAEADCPLREEVLDTMHSPDREEPEAILTRNSYGVTVLNAARVLFADLDVENTAPEPAQNVWGMLFGSAKAESPVANDGKGQVERYAQAHPGVGIRLYQTFGGFRAVILNAVFDPLSAESNQLLRDLASDPLYIRLCQSQRCFRARLTPKPWRCGVPALTASYPYSNSDTRTLQQWLSQYNRQSASFTTCRLAGQYGPQEVRPEVGRILAVHDRYAIGNAALPLA